MTPGTGTGEAGDQYTGLDRFGRVVEQKWQSEQSGLKRVPCSNGMAWELRTVYATARDGLIKE